VESRVNQGLIQLNQTVTGEKLATDAVARHLFANSINRLLTYQPVGLPVTTLLPADSQFAALLGRLGVSSTPAKDVATAIAAPGIAIIEANTANLTALNGNRAALDKFTQAGGNLVLHGLEPEALTEFNKLVGVQHNIRPFTMEAVSVALPRDPKSAGLGLRDLVMVSGEKVAPWMGLLWNADDQFTYVVDAGLDILPFAKLDGQAPMAKAPRNPHVRNITNGFTTEEFWRYIHYINMEEGGKPVLNVELPGQFTATKFEIILNRSYKMPRKLLLSLDGAAPITMNCIPDGSVQVFDLPATPFTKMTLELTDFTGDTDRQITGIDNMRLFIKRPAEFTDRVKPLTEPGGIVRYPAGPGNIMLCNLNVKANEANPRNAAKKSNITKVLLENLGAQFAGAAAVVPGSANLTFTNVAPSDSQ
jgi:hypothetical protein